MATAFTPSNLPVVVSDSTVLDAGTRSVPDKKPLDIPVLVPDLQKDTVDNSPSGQPGGYADQSSGFDSGNSASTHEDENIPPQPLTLERWLQAGGVQPFQYDPNKTNEENLSGIFTWMNSVFDLYKYSSSDAQMNFGNLLSYVFSSLNNSKNNYIRDLSDSASLELAEKITDVTYSFINQMYNQAASLQAWYLQQEYNSPLNQINRLTEAGLSSAFALGGLSSGNASSPASVPMIQQPAASDAGQAQQQSESNWLSFLGAGLSAAASFIPGVGGAVGSLMNAAFQQFVGKKMLPYNIAQAGADLVTAGQSYLNLREANDQMKANVALQEFNAGKSSLEMSDQLSRNQMEAAKSRYDSEYEKFSEEYEELGWQTNVKTKEGHTESRVLNSEQVKNICRGNTTLEDGSTVVGITSAEKLRESNINLNAGLSLPFAGDVGVSGGAHAADKNTTTNSDTHNKSKTTSVGNESEQGSSSEGYKLDGSSFKLQDAEFKSVTMRHRLPLPKYAEHLNKLRLEYERLLDNYNTLTEGNKARLHLLQDNLTRNISKLSSGVVKARYQKLLKDMLTPNPDTLVGD